MPTPIYIRTYILVILLGRVKFPDKMSDWNQSVQTYEILGLTMTKIMHKIPQLFLCMLNSVIVKKILLKSSVPEIMILNALTRQTQRHLLKMEII